MKKSTAKKVKKSSAKKKSRGKKSSARRRRQKRTRGRKCQIRQSYSRVFAGKAKKTLGGLQKKDLVRNKQGKIVSKKRSEQAKALYRKHKLDRYFKCVLAAKKALGQSKKFVPIGGKTAKGQQLHKKIQELYRKWAGGALPSRDSFLCEVIPKTGMVPRRGLFLHGPPCSA